MKILVVGLLVGLVGCQTQFTGSPHIDPGTCQAKCAADRLVMTGMVYMGEYSSACLCEVPRPAEGPPSAGAGAGAVGAAAGVVMQMRRNAESQRHH